MDKLAIKKIHNYVPLAGSWPLDLSSACSWQRAQASQQKCTQQSQHGSAGNPYFARSFSL